MMVDGFFRPTSAVARREALLLVELSRSAEARAGLRYVVKELRRAGFSIQLRPCRRHRVRLVGEHERAHGD